MADGTGAAGAPLRIEVWSDIACPWCWLGKRRLARALEAVAGEVPVEVAWCPFQLAPDLPPEGAEKRAYMTARFGDWDAFRAKEEELAAHGAAEGVGFRFERQTRAPNTLRAHRLAGWAAERSRGDEVVDALFRAHFQEGRDVGDPAVLAEIAAEAGLDASEAAAFLATEAGADDVRRQQARAGEMGIRAVPSFVLDGRYLVQGAQDAETLAGVLREVQAERAAAGM